MGEASESFITAPKRQTWFVRLHVAADDRTGAIETAAVLADRTGAPVPVAVWPDFPPPSPGVAVVDLASRYVEPAEAAARARSLPATGRLAHKIDSTLRGNWAVELVARHHTAGMPVLVVPALPALGRVCVGGSVLVDGQPVHVSETRDDPRGGPRSSRPAEHLEAAGAPVTELRDRASIAGWLRSPSGVAVADASDDTDIATIAERWHAADEVVLAGTSAVIGAVIGQPAQQVPRRIVQPPTLVVCGSAHPSARRQIDCARRRGATVVERVEPAALAAMAEGAPLILWPPVLDGPAEPDAADTALSSLVAEAASVVESGHVGTLILIGGETAAALLGDALVAVLGSVAPGTALLESLIVDVPVIARAGGFGNDDALAELLWGSA